jgi:hypothetical protein
MEPDELTYSGEGFLKPIVGHIGDRVWLAIESPGGFALLEPRSTKHLAA